MVDTLTCLSIFYSVFFRRRRSHRTPCVYLLCLHFCILVAVVYSCFFIFIFCLLFYLISTSSSSLAKESFPPQLFEKFCLPKPGIFKGESNVTMNTLVIKAGTSGKAETHQQHLQSKYLKPDVFLAMLHQFLLYYFGLYMQTGVQVHCLNLVV